MAEGTDSPPGDDFTAVSRRVLDDLHDRVGMNTWMLARRDGDDQIVLAARGDAFGLVAGTRLRWADTFCAQMVEQGAPMAAGDLGRVPAYAEARARNGILAAALLTVPVAGPDGEHLGTLVALDGWPNQALDDNLATVQVQAGLLGALLAHELHRADETRRNERADSVNDLDPLTRTRNRRAWDAALRAEEGRANRYVTAAAVVIVSLDRLRDVNSQFGHRTGDQVLVQAAGVMARRLRGVDVLARIGGDDFGIILAGSGPEGIRAVVDGLRSRLRDARIPVSIGAARRTAAGGMLGAWKDAEAGRNHERAAPPAGSDPGAELLHPGVERPGGAEEPFGTGLSSVDALLTLARDQLGMEVAFLNTFHGPDRRFRNLVSSIDLPIRAGHVESREGTFCQLIADGRIGEVTPDVSKDPVLRDLPVTERYGIGSYIGIPLHRRDGELYGTLCAYSRSPDPSLRERDTGVLRAVAGVMMDLVESEDQNERHVHDVLERLDTLYAAGGPDVVYQPIVTLDRLETVGVEALSRFPAGTANPQEWFISAATAGVGPRLELTAARNALAALPHVPGFLALNVSPATLVSPGFMDVIARLPLHRIVVEITEHEAIDDYETLAAVLRPLRADGLRVAVDDAGAGFASMRHILALVPDFIKLDISLVRGIDRDTPRQALAAALAAFAFKTGAVVVAEGIETVDEFHCLRMLNIDCGQGYHLSRPAPILAGHLPTVARPGEAS